MPCLPSSIWRKAFLAILILSFSAQIKALEKELPSAAFRADVVTPLSRLLCPQTVKESRLGLQDLWKVGLYDAAIKVQLIRKQSSSPFRQEDLRGFARHLMEKFHYGSYSFGVCHRQRAWAAALPAPISLHLQGGGGSVSLPPPSLTTKYCQRLSLDFAPALEEGFSPQELPLGPELNSFLVGKFGFISLSCLPSPGSSLGPMLWYLAPTLSRLAIRLPAAKVLSQIASPQDRLTAWLNALRQLAKLEALDFSSPWLAANAAKLAESESLHHDRPKMHEVAQELAAKHLTPLGEDRVEAGSLEELTRLWWASPRHRKLILDSRAQKAGLSLLEKDGHFFALLLTAF